MAVRGVSFGTRQEALRRPGRYGHGKWGPGRLPPGICSPRTDRHSAVLAWPVAFHPGHYRGGKRGAAPAGSLGITGSPGRGAAHIHRRHKADGYSKAPPAIRPGRDAGWCNG
jgi:hypothetical protein